MKTNKGVLVGAAGVACIVVGKDIILRTRIKKLSKSNEILTLANQLHHYMVTGLADPTIDAQEFMREVEQRLEFVKLVSRL